MQKGLLILISKTFLHTKQTPAQSKWFNSYCRRDTRLTSYPGDARIFVRFAGGLSCFEWCGDAGDNLVSALVENLEGCWLGERLDGLGDLLKCDL